MMFPRRILNQESGFTLVEVMVAVIILSFALLPMLAMFDFGVKAQQQGEYALIALNLGEGKMETLLADFLQDNSLTAGTTNEIVYVGNVPYTVQSTVTSPAELMQDIHVTVQYSFYNGAKSISLSTKVVSY